jgi:CheY-like chemotaxis protein
MVVLLVILTIVVFIMVDFAVRTILRKREEAQIRQERAEALDIGLKLDHATDAVSLKRVEVENPHARILAVDDEPVVLDSFRKILVLEGYSVDTVESAEEALGLVRRHDYDFVFTDLKMPGMDGLDLTKAVKHLRPDIDVVVITGYATIETAVETMRFGAMNYVEKPFTADELAAFTKQCLIRRQSRIEQQTPPTVKVVTAPGTESGSPNVINVPGGLFVSPEHTWVNVGVTGEGRIGLDDLALKTLGTIDEIEFPSKSSHVNQGDPLFVVRRGDHRLVFSSPLTGTISKVNHEITYQLEVLARKPATTGWICAIEPENLTAELAQLRIGADALKWYETQVGDFWDRILASTKKEDTDQELWEAVWQAFATTYLKSNRAPVQA